MSVPETEGSASAKRRENVEKKTLKVPQIELRVRCHERLCELSMRVATRRRLHEDPRRVNHPLVRYHTAPVVPHYPAFVPDQLSESEEEQGIILCIAQNPKCTPEIERCDIASPAKSASQYT